MVHTFTIEGLPVQTGDILCTHDGKPDILPGEFWRLIGRLVPGDIDHVLIYLGPGGRCIEAGARGVVTFDVPGGRWDTQAMARQRGLLFDTLHGIAYPLDQLELAEGEEQRMRASLVEFLLAQVGKPYNLNLLDPDREDAYYCSQLVYRAYLKIGVDLNTGLSIESLPGSNRIVYPQEIWQGCPHRAVVG